MVCRFSTRHHPQQRRLKSRVGSEYGKLSGIGPSERKGPSGIAGPPADEPDGGEGGINIHRLNFATTLANFCRYYQRYQSLATVRTTILPVSLEKQIWHVLAFTADPDKTLFDRRYET
jgi:hypothetical protein